MGSDTPWTRLYANKQQTNRPSTADQPAQLLSLHYALCLLFQRKCWRKLKPSWVLTASFSPSPTKSYSKGPPAFSQTSASWNQAAALSLSAVGTTTTPAANVPSGAETGKTRPTRPATRKSPDRKGRQMTSLQEREVTLQQRNAAPSSRRRRRRRTRITFGRTKEWRRSRSWNGREPCPTRSRRIWRSRKWEASRGSGAASGRTCPSQRIVSGRQRGRRQAGPRAGKAEATSAPPEASKGCYVGEEVVQTERVPSPAITEHCPSHSGCPT